MVKPTGFWVRIFLPSAEPEGLRIVEKSNWTGQGLVFPRSLFAEVRQRSELRRTGVYVLWGPGESDQLPCIYVGEGDPVLSRLDQHAKSKEFWTHAAVFASKDQNLNKAHVQHLEARLIALAVEAKRCELDNQNQPQTPSLSEADEADAEGFLTDLLLCLAVVGVSFFETPRMTASKHREFFLKTKGIEARGVDSAEGFIVRKGSKAVLTEVPSIQPYVSRLRAALVKKAVLITDGDLLRLAQDYTFNSPSTAAAVMLGKSANGLVEWRDATSRPLKEVRQDAAGGS